MNRIGERIKRKENCNLNLELAEKVHQRQRLSQIENRSPSFRHHIEEHCRTAPPPSAN